MNKKSFVILGVCCFLLFCAIVLHLNKNKVFYGDALGYYVYLPATFIHHNLDQIDSLASAENMDEEIASGIERFKISYPINENGNTIIQYTYGVALLYSPTFFASLAVDTLVGNNPTGFEKRYQTGIKFMGLLYLLAGLFFCFKSLQFYYSNLQSLLGVGFVFCGTNLLWFSFFQFGMAHIPLFFLYAGLLYFSLKQHHKFQNQNLVILACFTTLIILIRPSDVICLLIPLVLVLPKLIENFNLRLSLWILAAFGISMIIFLPQFCYWKSLTGNWLFYSYGDQGFNWSQPQIMKGLWGAKNGWFSYSPIMFFACLSFFFKGINSKIRVLFFLIVPVYIYIIYSWWCYNYINGFGSRPMIHLYPILVFGIVSITALKSDFFRFLGLWVLLICTLINISFSLKANKGLLFSDESTHSFNNQTFFKDHLDYNDLLLLDLDTKQAHQIKSDSIVSIIKADSLESQVKFDSISQFHYYENNSNESFPPFKINHEITEDISNFNWLKIAVNGRFDKHIFMPHLHHKIVLEINQINGNKIYKSIRINDKIGKLDNPVEPIQIRSTIINKWADVHFYYQTQVLNEGDQITVYIWNAANKSMDIKEISLSLCL